ncbi:MAG: TrmH family RNA methyltransferase [Pseudomonadales bacterium]
MPLDKRPNRERLNKTITLYGRNPVLEALNDNNLTIDRLHLADSNRPGAAINSMIALAERRNADIAYHSRKELSRISRNGRQDQGVAVDIFCPSLSYFDDWVVGEKTPSKLKLIVLDGITNPQNSGMIIRSCYAAGIDAILIGTKDMGAFNPLLVKASAGTALRAPLVYSQDLVASLKALRDRGVIICTLAADAPTSLFHPDSPKNGAFVFGNETDGVSSQIRSISNTSVSIPMQGQVESLNVAISAALVAFRVCNTG